MDIFTIPAHRRGDTWDGIYAVGININGTPINLSGAQIDMQLRSDYDSPAVLTLSTNTSSITILPSLSAFTIPPRVIDIPPANYKYDIQIITHANTALSAVKTYLEGTWKITYDITK